MYVVIFLWSLTFLKSKNENFIKEIEIFYLYDINMFSIIEY